MYNHIRYGQLKRIEGVTVFLVKGPAYRLVQLLDRDQRLLGNVAHDGVDDLALVVALFAANDILGGDSALRQIDISCGPS